ncbi:MAG: cell division protein FtsA, partial [Saprospiraceae bacterium]|nr:cell division protein FtsA [Saprospiraceae bacterium]
VLWEIRRSGYERKLIGGIVLTGGGSLLAHSEKLAEFHTGMTCRIGVPVENLAHGYHEAINSPIFSTAIGLLLRGLHDVETGTTEAPAASAPDDNREPSNVSEEKEASWLDSVFRKTKEWFEAEPDMDFERKK